MRGVAVQRFPSTTVGIAVQFSGPAIFAVNRYTVVFAVKTVRLRVFRSGNHVGEFADGIDL
jgi:hypothetical protein